MNHLLRELAPLSEAAWAAVDAEARQRLTTALAARKLVDFSGPHGWAHAATPLGRTGVLGATPGDGVQARQRRVMPLVELRLPFTLSRAQLDDVDRGALDVDLGTLDTAAARMAEVENAVVFHGYEAAGITGILASSSHPEMPLGDDPGTSYPRAVARAVEAIRHAGVGGPYGLAIGPDGYTAVIETTEHGGYPLFDHLSKILNGPVVWAPGLTGAAVLSLRGGDFILESGQDLSIGYLSHTAEDVTLYLEETVSFRVTEPDAAVALPG
jgi:uncharacterized linocin/CFP29 family protein